MIPVHVRSFKAVYDLSAPISNDLRSYPGDPDISIEQIRTHESDGYRLSKICLNTHSGTHADMPLHFFAGGKSAAEADISCFIGEACLVSANCPSKMISLNDVDLNGLAAGSILVLKTGWESKFGAPEYFKSHPGLSLNLVSELIRIGVKLVATDLPSCDRYGNPPKAHSALLSNNIPIIESLVNLGRLPGKYFLFSAVPLKIHQGDGSPVRAFAVYE